MAIRNITEAYFEHGADIGVIGRGATPEAAFEGAAAATFALMTDLAAVAPRESVQVRFEEADPELALVTWLNELLAQARVHNLVFSRFRLRHRGDLWEGEAAGGPWREGMTHGVEVKGATLTMLKVEQNAGRWEARCVVDV